MNHRVDIFVNRRKRLRIRTPCLPEYLDELIVGYLWTKSELDTAEDLLEIVSEHSGRMIYVTLREREPLQSCCRQVCSGGIDPGACSLQWFQKLRPYCRHAKADWCQTMTYTPGNCILMRDGEMELCIKELSWQNAMYKVIGWAILHNKRLSDYIFFTVGLVTLEKARLILDAGVGLLATEIPPTERALDQILEAGVSVVAVEAEGMSIHTGEEALCYDLNGQQITEEAPS